MGCGNFKYATAFQVIAAYQFYIFFDDRWNFDNPNSKSKECYDSCSTGIYKLLLINRYCFFFNDRIN